MRSCHMFAFLSCLWLVTVCHAFHHHSSTHTTTTTTILQRKKGNVIRTQQQQQISQQQRFPFSLCLQPESDEEAEQMEQVRLNIWKSRRNQVRGMLKSAESLRNFRLANGFVPELDPTTGRPIKSDGKAAVTLTAFALAAGAIVLRIGGRAALVSAVGLDFLTDNPELQGQVQQVLEYSETMDPILKVGIFCAGWTFTKVFCFDAAGIVLALSSGILFGGVLPGTLMSAFGATVGSSVAFALAKADTPVRKKALEIVQENPSLRGIEKVVAEDGLKAVLTLRLAPVLPIPLGMYNYVYGISNVKYLDFAGGIFLGSLKPYLLDSYLGYFGKTLVDGTAGQDGGWQDYILVAVLGVSVLIGVFASQLASETWDAVLEEQKSEEKAEKSDDKNNDDGVVTEIFGQQLPEWMVGFQYALQDADDRMTNLVYEEYEAEFWNVTEGQPLLGNPVEQSPDMVKRNPALKPTSPEVANRYKGIDLGASTCDGLVLSPILFSFFLQLSDPLFDETVFLEERRKEQERNGDSVIPKAVSVPSSTPQKPNVGDDRTEESNLSESTNPSLEFQTGVMINRIQALRDETKQKLQDIDKKLGNTK
ncbi:SNARE associated golgi protein [Nitzschia inconspicua]|uniref:SNARE associated golgi protein n=1 Tax=Nitzschia inconspicua TaxID=303405 RepID=A0A9K3KSH2_9STRA|nr:SNARE associated golgi protein [Nitzschia inconspicua]